MLHGAYIVKNEFNGNIGQLVQAGTANVSVNAVGESIWQMFGHCSNDEILQIKQQIQDEIIALQQEEYRFILPMIAVSMIASMIMYAVIHIILLYFFVDIHQWIWGNYSRWLIGLAIFCFTLWVFLVDNPIEDGTKPKIDKLKKDREHLDDILRYRQYLLVTQDSPTNQGL